MNRDIERVLYSQTQIAETCQQLGAQLSKDYHGKKPLVICVLKGAILFMSDLVRQMDTDMEMDFMDVSSYGNATESSGAVKILKDLDISATDRDVLIVEDIIDTGRTLACLVDLLNHRHAKTVKICTLLDKPERREKKISPDYVGFKVPNEFVVGYGLDYQGLYRNLPYVGILKPEIYMQNQ
ncbi:hypoxanthine phosphoribosyltransferase [Liquorilactobacillus vini]|uniref:hypoxanthine phosphoribosyltransferase n=1 Tax=Liquorilactobacillus vini TaxID=238015 RepID=UPI00029AD223|nr:hypoxanthine phosphoribosyltransferase [Liquorilactobacillus vini]